MAGRVSSRCLLIYALFHIHLMLFSVLYVSSYIQRIVVLAHCAVIVNLLSFNSSDVDSRNVRFAVMLLNRPSNSNIFHFDGWICFVYNFYAMYILT